MKKGFTLIEVLTAIMLVGILSTFAVSSYQGARAKAKLNNAAMLVESAFNEARNLSLTGAAVSYGLELDADSADLKILNGTDTIRTSTLPDDFKIGTEEAGNGSNYTLADKLFFNFSVPKADLNITFEKTVGVIESINMACFYVTNATDSHSFTVTSSTAQLTSGDSCSPSSP